MIGAATCAALRMRGERRVRRSCEIFILGLLREQINVSREINISGNFSGS